MSDQNKSTDLVVRIREHEGAYLFPKTADALLKEAADEIERLRGRIARGTSCPHSRRAPMADERAEINCETQGHFRGPGEKCVFCGHPMPSEAVPSKEQVQRFSGWGIAMLQNKPVTEYVLASDYDAMVADRDQWKGRADQLRDELEHPETSVPRSFQDRVFDWARDCFGEADTTDRQMRTFRFLEEALELAQACGCPKYSAQHVLDYVYGRPTGEVSQETGGTMVSLAVLCQAFGIGMNRCAEAELARVLGRVEQIRARHAAKPDFAVKTGAES